MSEVSMLERVAQSQLDRFIERGTARLGGPAFVPGTRLAALPKSYRDDFLADAKAAIEAMREPTEAMNAAGVVFLPHHASIPSEAEAGYVWSAMIDTALKGAVNA